MIENGAMVCIVNPYPKSPIFLRDTGYSKRLMYLTIFFHEKIRTHFPSFTSRATRKQSFPTFNF